jgi:hypothetical protein
MQFGLKCPLGLWAGSVNYWIWFAVFTTHNPRATRRFPRGFSGHMSEFLGMPNIL